jgi:homoserine O-succinyltransferase/O-acetyltransferase
VPVFLVRPSSNSELVAYRGAYCGNSSAKIRVPAERCLRIGLINNMPDAALEATERQYLKLLQLAAGGVLVRLSLYTLPEIPRGRLIQSRVGEFYSGIEDLWNSQLDGLIVTGREPSAENLADEPYWGSLTRVLDSANHNTVSAIWSCLAAHAAILYTDGVSRQKNDRKHCGVFECARLSDHRLMADTPEHLMMPHSRWNGVQEDELRACDYTLLTKSQDLGPDTFVKQLKSLFVFFQGHPEYEPETLLLEYRRDVRRYCTGETDRYPLLPNSYFDKDTAETLTALREKAPSGWREELLANLEAAVASSRISNTWRSTARRVYRTWVEYICARTEGRQRRDKILTSAPVPLMGTSTGVPEPADSTTTVRCSRLPLEVR